MPVLSRELEQVTVTERGGPLPGSPASSDITSATLMPFDVPPINFDKLNELCSITADLAANATAEMEETVEWRAKNTVADNIKDIFKSMPFIKDDEFGSSGKTVAEMFFEEPVTPVVAKDSTDSAKMPKGNECANLDAKTSGFDDMAPEDQVFFASLRLPLSAENNQLSKDAETGSNDGEGVMMPATMTQAGTMQKKPDPTTSSATDPHLSVRDRYVELAREAKRAKKAHKKGEKRKHKKRAARKLSAATYNPKLTAPAGLPGTFGADTLLQMAERTEGELQQYQKKLNEALTTHHPDFLRQMPAQPTPAPVEDAWRKRVAKAWLAGLINEHAGNAPWHPATLEHSGGVPLATIDFSHLGLMTPDGDVGLLDSDDDEQNGVPLPADFDIEDNYFGCM